MTRAGHWLSRALLAIAMLCLGAPSARALNLRQLPGAPAAPHASGLPSPAPSAQALAHAAQQETGLPASQLSTISACPAPSPGYAGCAAQVVVQRSDRHLVHPHPAARRTFSQIVPHRTHATGAGPAAGTTSSTASPPGAGTPAYLQQAYDLTYLSATAGAGDTIAIVDAGDDPNAESDLATYRSRYGLSACTTANGCFQKVNQSGQSSPLPGQVPGWREEESLDLDAVSALCPNCHIVFVVTDSNSTPDLDAGVSAAQALHATQISASWGTNAASPLGTGSFPGANVLAAAGDSGYAGAGTSYYPAASPGITAVGATTLSPSSSSSSARGYNESAWSLTGGAGGGSGCNTAQAKPAYQTDTGCTGRSYADVSADGNPSTGLLVYDAADGGWLVIGGTSLAVPLVAAYEAVTGIVAVNGQWAYTDSALLNDPISGSTGSCAAAISYICNAGTGYDGPTGSGSISGDVATGAPGIGGPAIGNGANNTYAQTVGGTTASLTGGVYPNGLDTHYSWQYGQTNAYGSQTTSTDAGAGALPAAAPANLTGLQPSTTYHYRLVAANAGGTTYGYDYAMTTAPAGAVAPVSTVAPAIGGTVQQGQTLSTTTGSWSPAPSSYGYQWQRSTDGGATWSSIGSATNQNYTVVAGDLNDDIHVVVTANDAWGSTTISSALVGPVASGAPVNTVYPTIGGTAQQGQALTAAPGTWSPSAGTYTYQWQSSTDGGSTWNPLPGATGPTYSVVGADLGADLRVIVTGQDAFGSSNATAAMVGPVSSGTPANTMAPSVSGTPNQGQVLSVVSTWNPAGAYTYRWQQSTDGGTTWTDISGAAGATYTLGAGDVGHRLRVTMTATNGYGQASATSAGVGPVLSTQPTPVSVPTLSGTAQRTYQLTATSGVWTGPNLTYAYQWQRSPDGSNWQSIAAATNSTYTVAVADEGDQVRVVASASNPTGVASQSSAPTQVVSPYPPANTTAPAITGTARRGRTLNASRGVWTGPDNNYTYQWQEDFGEGYVDVSGATSPAYTLTTADEGDTVRVLVTATNPDAAIVQTSTPSAAVVADAPVNDSPPVISGSAQRGTILTADPGAWEGLGDTTAYQWQRSTDGGTTWTGIGSQTSANYTIGTADEGAQLRAVVTVTNPDGSASAAASPTSTIPPAPPVNTATPTISGSAQRGQLLTSATGSWGGIANAYADQWQRSNDGSTWTAISGATSSSYTLAVADEGSSVRLQVTATNADGTVSAASTGTTTVVSSPPANTMLPQVSGVAQRSQTLSANAGAWSGLDNVFTCQWQHSTDGGTTWSDIAGATAWSYSLAVGDEGSRLRAQVTATNADGASHVTTAATATVAAAPPTLTAPPVITGAVTRGTTLNSTGGAWNGAGNTYALQWQRSPDGGTTWTNIAGATGTSYTLATIDEGDPVRLMVTATNPDGALAAPSAPTATVTASAPTRTALPTINGAAQRGTTLSGAQGTWTGNGTTYALQWQLSSDGATTWTDISGATGTTYTPAIADESDVLRLVVTASNADGSATAASAATAPVAATPPAVTAAPTASGTAARNAILTGTPGTWSGVGNVYTYAWQRSADGSTWTGIPGAVSLSYTITAADEGDRVRLQVSAANADATLSAATTPTAVIPSAPPANSAPPAIAGAAQRGIILTSSQGAWSGVANVYTYQWQRSTDGTTWTPITGAASGSYTLAVADEGASVRLQVTATNPDGTVSAASAPTATVVATPPVNSAVPTVSGTPVRAGSLTSGSGTWTGIGNYVLYQWQRSPDGTNWANITAATGNAYAPTAADEGDRIRLQVFMTNPDGSATATSVPTSAVLGAPPVNTVLPILSGTPQRTGLMQGSAGTWSGVGNLYSYQWQRTPDGSTWTDVTGATNPAYTPVAADEDQRLRLVVTATNPDGAVAAASAASTVLLGAPPVNTRAPSVSGAPHLGTTLQAGTGSWTPDATSYAYQWQRCDPSAGSCQPVAGATSATYALISGDVGSTIRVAVSATNPDGTATATSDATSVVVAPPTNIDPPLAPSGTLTDAGTLTADHGTWDTPATYTYNWVRCADGATAVTAACTTAGAGATYALTASDVGSEIAVRVTATSPGGAVTVTSALTATVTGRPLIGQTPPSITGSPYPPHQLTAHPGTWSVSLTSTSYTWQRCDADGVSNCVQLASGVGTYTLTSADTGHTILVVANIASPGQTATATSGALTVQNQPLPTPTAQPSISGNPARGSTLQAAVGSWTNNPSSITLDWQRCDASGNGCQSIPGANQGSYTPSYADEGSALTVAVTAVNSEGSGTARAPATVPVAASPPVATHPPTFSARPQQGTALTITGLLWSTTPDTTYVTSWQRCDAGGNGCQTISGAGPSYTPLAADVGHALIGTVTASNVDGAVPASTAVSATILPSAPRWHDLPALAATDGHVGTVVDVTGGSWSGPVVDTDTVELMRCTNICVSDGTSSHYTIDAADTGAILRVRETAANAGGFTVVWSAQYVGPVASLASASAVLGSAPMTLRNYAGTALATARLQTGVSAHAATAQAVTAHAATTHAATAHAAAARAVTAGRRPVVRRFVVIRRARAISGKLRAWACPTAEQRGRPPAPCTGKLTLAASGRLALPAAMTGRLRIVVVRVPARSRPR